MGLTLTHGQGSRIAGVNALNAVRVAVERRDHLGIGRQKGERNVT